jgi:hypothetical protein
VPLMLRAPLIYWIRHKTYSSGLAGLVALRVSNSEPLQHPFSLYHRTVCRDQASQRARTPSRLDEPHPSASKPRKPRTSRERWRPGTDATRPGPVRVCVLQVSAAVEAARQQMRKTLGSDYGTKLLQLVARGLRALANGAAPTDTH